MCSWFTVSPLAWQDRYCEGLCGFHSVVGGIFFIMIPVVNHAATLLFTNHNYSAAQAAINYLIYLKMLHSIPDAIFAVAYYLVYREVSQRKGSLAKRTEGE